MKIDFAAFFLAMAALLGVPEFVSAQDTVQGQEFIHPLSGITLESLSATRSHPLFTPSRQRPVIEPSAEPIVVNPEPEPVARLALPPLQLVGVLMTGTQRLAVMRDAETGVLHRLHSGERIQGWTLTILDPRRIAFESTEGRHIQALFDEAAATEPQERSSGAREKPAGLWR